MKAPSAMNCPLALLITRGAKADGFSWTAQAFSELRNKKKFSVELARALHMGKPDIGYALAGMLVDASEVPDCVAAGLARAVEVANAPQRRRAANLSQSRTGASADWSPSAFGPPVSWPRVSRSACVASTASARFGVEFRVDRAGVHRGAPEGVGDDVQVARRPVHARVGRTTQGVRAPKTLGEAQSLVPSATKRAPSGVRRAPARR